MKNRRNRRRVSVLAAAAAVTVLLAQTALAGSWNWNSEKDKWWYLDDQNTFPVNGWEWIDGKCYRFDEEGFLYTDTVTPEGLTVNSDGAWTINGVVQEMETILKESSPKQEIVIQETEPETQPAETTAAAEAETKPAETAAAETQPAETTAAETQPAETTAAETQPAETTAAATQPAETTAASPYREEGGRMVTPWFSFPVPEAWVGRYACRVWDDNAVDLCSKANLSHGGTLFTVICSETYREQDSFPDYGEIRYLGFYQNSETGKDNYLYYAGPTGVTVDQMDPLKMVEFSAMQVTEPEVLNNITGPHGEPLHFQGKAY